MISLRNVTSYITDFFCETAKIKKKKSFLQVNMVYAAFKKSPYNSLQTSDKQKYTVGSGLEFREWRRNGEDETVETRPLVTVDAAR